jgi:dimethylhistidine N-methyltransferase
MNSITVASVNLFDLKPDRHDFRRDFLGGLHRSNKELPSKYFYDREGAALFDRICELPEYYLTRTEANILRNCVPEVVGLVGPVALLVELGSGSSVKTRLLLDHLECPAAYVPVDIARRHLIQTVRALQKAYPHLQVLPVCADYSQELHFPVPLVPPRRTFFFFPGSTIGNFSPAQAERFLGRLLAMAGDEGALLVGVDQKKDPGILETAYNDTKGVTSAFNKNILARANRELEADFDLRRFEHLAFYNEQQGRIEMHLVSLDSKLVMVGDEPILFAEGESILTEYSYKYHPEEFMQLARRAGWTPTALWTDEDDLFGVHYLTKS